MRSSCYNDPDTYLMNSRSKRITTILALLLLVYFSNVYLGVSFAAPEGTTAAADTPAPTQQIVAGILTTAGNKPVSVDGASAITGTTIFSGATIETPTGVAANVSLGSLGSVDLEQDTKLTLTYQSDRIKVVLLAGCVTVTANKGVTGEIETSKDMVSRTDPEKGGVLRVCHPDSVLEAGVVVAPAVGALSGLFGAAVPAALVVVPAILPGDNPSNSIPN